MRNSALASAALTSVALLAQTANAAPSAGDETPSREEVSRRISSLYDQAESDTGTFNATRASATGPRKRADRPTDTGRRPAATARDSRNEESRRGDPALDSVARQWFDVARSKLGPTVPAVLPRDRMPDRPTGARSARPAERAMDGLTDRARDASGRAALELPAVPVAELPAAPVAELPAAVAPGTAPVAELTAGPIAALPAAPETPPETGWATQGTQSTRSTETALALPAPTAEPAAEVTAAPQQQRSSLRTTKERNQRKLDRARELMSAHTARQTTSLLPIETPLGQASAADTWNTAPARIQPSADTRWEALQDLGAADLTPVPAGSTAWSGTAVQPVDTTAATAINQPTVTSGAFDTGQSFTASQAYDTSQALTPIPRYDTSQALTSIPGYDTSQVLTPSQTFDTSSALTATAPQDTRAVRALDFARAQIGKPCVWGTTGPDAYDGGGLTQAAWKAAGITLPRTPQEQATAGRGIALTYVEPGDLVLFHVGHVGIYSGNGMMIHAPGPGAVIREESIHYAGESAIHSVIRPA
ncbi:C40 family peptidase [Streptomyces bicolor]|uniref:C40 family peptidase n=1 Tax=Streptomyces bicolor TaxID=66874 RepID=UPI001F41B977|nr:C40 family peptidase [Streptomyces bicolor]